jgi:hypothetical protein
MKELNDRYQNILDQFIRDVDGLNNNLTFIGILHRILHVAYKAEEHGSDAIGYYMSKEMYDRLMAKDTAEDELQRGACVTNCPDCGWQGRENETHTCNTAEDECKLVTTNQPIHKVLPSTAEDEPSISRSQSRRIAHQLDKREKRQIAIREIEEVIDSIEATGTTNPITLLDVAKQLLREDNK